MEDTSQDRLIAKFVMRGWITKDVMSGMAVQHLMIMKAGFATVVTIESEEDHVIENTKRSLSVI
jgi:hypothetical protein